MVNGLWKVIGLCRKDYWVLYSGKGLGFGSGLRERFGFRKGLGLDGFWALIIIVIIIIIIIMNNSKFNKNNNNNTNIYII